MIYTAFTPYGAFGVKDNKDVKSLDDIEYKKQKSDISCTKIGDKVYYMNPTPQKANKNAYSEVWKTKEVGLPSDETWGDMGVRGIMMEALTGVTLALAGGDLLIMRHPKAIELCKKLFSQLVG